MSKGEQTRARILEAARGLLEAGEADVSMRAIAAAADVTRQLLYHHYDGRAHLLLELSRVIDRDVRTPELQARVDDAPTAVEALDQLVAVQGVIKPRIAAITTAMDRLRTVDGDVAAAWDEREDARLARCRLVVQRLGDEGVLKPSWPVEDASVMTWGVTSQASWSAAVAKGYPTDWWVQTTASLLTGALVAS